MSSALVVVTLAAYRSSFSAAFIFDDIQWIIEDPSIRRLPTTWRPLAFESRPLVQLSLALNYAWGELDVRGYHLFNFLVHITAGLLLFGIVRRTIVRVNDREGRTLPAVWLAFAVALLWLLHPLQTQAVTYVIQRCESMMAMFFLLCLYCVVRGAEGRYGWIWYAAAILACWAGMYCKQVIVVAAPIVLLFDRVFLAPSWREVLLRRGWMHAVLWASCLLLVVRLLPSIAGGERGTAGFAFRHVTPWEYLQTQAGVILHYLQLACWPHTLCLDYDWRPVTSFWQIYPQGVLVAGLLAASCAALWFRPWIGCLGLCFFLILAPTSSIMPIADIAVEHRMYLPLAPLLALAVLAVYGAGQRWLPDPSRRRAVYLVILVMVSGALFLRTSDRNRDYRDPQRMWSQVVRVSPHNPRAHFSLGAAYGQKGDRDKERYHYERALELKPDYARAHGNLAILLMLRGEDEQAAYHLRQAMVYKPDYVRAIVNYGNLLARQEKFDEAQRYYRRALSLEPGNPNALQNMATALWRQGRARQAMDLYRDVLRREPKMVYAKIRLAWLLATAQDSALRNGREAVQLAEQVQRQIGIENFRVLDTLAAAYAETGRFEEAARAAARACELAQAEDTPDSRQELEELRQRAELYQNRQPYRDNIAGSAGRLEDKGMPNDA